MTDSIHARRQALAQMAAFGLAPALQLGSAQAATNPSAWTPDELGEMAWLDWRASALATGPVSAWKDAAGGVVATQKDVTRQPVRTSDGQVVFSGNNRALDIPLQPLAYIAHRAVFMLFRANLATAKNSSGSLFYINGIDSGSTSRQPAVTYAKSGSQSSIGVQWPDYHGSNGLAMNASTAYGDWHCLVSRRVDGKHFFSLDGAPEVQVGDSICVAPHNKALTGLIGDQRTTNSLEWALDTLMVFQGELGADDAQRLAGWGMWKRGAQARLPANHAYRYSAPLKTAGVTAQAYAETTTAQWTGMQQYWASTPSMQSNFRQPLNLSGYRLVFEDHFTSMTVTDELTGQGPWWSPVHPCATGSAATARGSDLARVFSQHGSELTLKMLRADKGWMSGTMCSVNINGVGNSWKYGYFEVRARCTGGNGYGAWPALWLKSLNEFLMLTESRLELDFYEGYSSDPKGHHQALHNWPAQRLVPGRITQQRWVSNYTGLKAATWGEDVNLFDNSYHTYGVMIDDSWVVLYFDQCELARFPTPPEAKQEVYMLVDLALNPNEARQAQGNYELTLDYVRVFQR